MSDDAFAARALSPDAIAAHLVRRFGLAPRLGIEREFYLLGGDPARFVAYASDMLAAETELLLHCQAEAGPGQFEYSLRDTGEICRLVETVRCCDERLEHAAQRVDGRIAWSATPLAGHAPSGMHVHVTLHDRTGVNRFAKPDGTINGRESPILLAAVAGLLITMRPLIAIFAPTSECYCRLDQRAYPEVQFAPTTVSWGSDNRSVALRLPASAAAPERRRIEHRLASPMASIESALGAILAGLWSGLEARQPPAWPKTLGLANHPSRQAPLLPSSLDSAMQWFDRAGAPLLDVLAAQMGRATVMTSEST